jgi:hypothetical protein
VSFGGTGAAHPGSTFEAVRTQLAMLAEQLEIRQRSLQTMQRILLDFEGDEKPLQSYDAFIDWAGRYHEIGVDEVVVHWPIPDSLFDADRVVFERIATEGHEALQRWTN